MHPLEKIIKKVCLEENFFDHHKKIVVGASGGPDSTALLHILTKLAKEFELGLVAAYLDHGLRPQESKDELEFVRSEAGRAGAVFEHGKVDVNLFARQQKVSTEDAARQLRYAFLREIAEKHGATKIAVGHNSDDQAEELLVRLLRGTAKKGLAGMDYSREEVIRPLLAVTKSEILAYLSDNKISYCQDSSNNERIYLRNKVRLDLLPYLESNFNPGIRKTLRQTAAILDEEENFLDSIIIKKQQKIVGGSRQNEIDLPLFKLEDKAIQRRLVEKVIWAMENKPSFRKIEQILRLANEGREGNQIHLDEGLRGLIEGQKLIFSFPVGRQKRRGDLFGKENYEVFVEIPTVGVYDIDKYRQVKMECLEGVPDLQDMQSAAADFFDLDKLDFPLEVRSVRPGDRFWPLGSPGRKKLADFFSDLKVPKRQRQKMLVLENAGEIAAVLGLRIDQSYRVCATTTRVLRIAILAAPGSDL